MQDEGRPASVMQGFIRRWLRTEIAIGVTAALFGVLWLWSPSGMYLWLKAFHVIAAIAWMAGMLYLPRLFVYHCEAEAGSKQSETFKVMERRLYRGIMDPAMGLVWLFGLLLAWQGDWWHAGWWQVKFSLVVGLTFVHQLYGRWRKAFEADRNTRPASYYRWWNEVPTGLMFVIVFLAVLKPF